VAQKNALAPKVIWIPAERLGVGCWGIINSFILTSKGFHMRFNKKSKAGFSLVELMIVVAIIGILSSLAVPRFQGFQAKAKATEGRTSLSHIFTLQNAYHGDNDAYGRLQDIGFSLNGATAIDDALAASTANKIRYAYAGVGPVVATFSATAISAIGALGGCQSETYGGTINQVNSVGGFVSIIPGCN